MTFFSESDSDPFGSEIYVLTPAMVAVVPEGVPVCLKLVTQHLPGAEARVGEVIVLWSAGELVVSKLDLASISVTYNESFQLGTCICSAV
jgi:hypothetical protein